MDRDQLVPDSAVRAIQESVRTEVIDVPEGKFATRKVFRRPAASIAATVELHTLASVVDYLTSNLDRLDPTAIAIYVSSHDSVEIIGGLFGEHRQRERLVDAGYEAPAFRWGQFYGCEEFVVALQSVFEDSGDRARVLAVVGNIKEEDVRATDDDGVTQSVTGRAGIVRSEELLVPNPVVLSPFRTFPEVVQPSSPFVLRMKKGNPGQLPTCGLFEADGGRWKLLAIENIARYFRVKLEELDEPLRSIAILA